MFSPIMERRIRPSGSCTLQLGNGVVIEPSSSDYWEGRLTTTFFILPLWGRKGVGLEVL